MRSISSLSLLWLAVCGLFLERALVLPTNHGDGAFQTMSALHRLHQGQFPGEAFLPYLGLGPLYSLYPFFSLAGGDLGASVFAASLATLLMTVVGVTVLMRCLGMSDRPCRTAWSVTLVLLLLRAVADTDIVPLGIKKIVIEQLYPGNSLKPVRSFAPYLLALAIPFAHRCFAGNAGRWATVGSIAGALLWWSNDYGLPTAAVAAAWILLQPTRNRAAKSVALLTAGAGFALTSTLVLWVATAFHPTALLEYNLLDVVSDQWWYFGPWTESERVFSIMDLGKLASARVLLSLCVLTVALILAWWRADDGHLLLLLIGLALLLGGLTASIGGHIDDLYFGPFGWWAMVISSLMLIRGIGHRIKGFPLLTRSFVRLTSHSGGEGRGGRLPLRDAATASPLAVLGASLLALAVSLGAYGYQRHRLANSASFFYASHLGGFLRNDWLSYVRLAETLDETPAVEEYWGIWSAINRVPSRTPVDSVIHALGRQRNRFVERLAARPPIAVSSRPDNMGPWQGWIISANWWFYSILLRDYVPYASSPRTIVWKTGRNPTWKEVGCQVDPGAKTLSLPSRSRDYYEVSVRFRFPHSQRALLMVWNGINYAAGAGGWLSIDPNASQATFPVLVDPDRGLSAIAFKALPARGELLRNLSIDQCSAKRITFGDGSEAILPTPPP